MFRVHHCLALIAAFTLGISASLGGTEEPDEGAPLFFAADLVDAELLRGPHHQVRPVVEVRDFGFVFRIQSDSGKYHALGVPALKETIREIEAIVRLNSLSQTEAFAATLSDSFKNPVVTTVGVARRPISTVAGLPSGIARYLQGKFYQVKKTSGKALGLIRGGDETEVETEQPEEKPSQSLTARVGSSASSLSRKHLGYDDAKREWARKLGVDPYSDNPKLQEALGRIAWASSIAEFAGGYAVPSSDAVSYAGKAKELVWTQSPHQLESSHIKALRRIGFDEGRIEAFTESPSYSLTEKAALVAAWEAIGPAEGKEAALDLILSAESQADALVMTRTLAILELYSEQVSPLARVAVEGGLLVAYGENGYQVLPLAVDYLHWNALISNALASAKLQTARREVWVSGEVSSISAYRLRDLQWHVFEKCFQQGPRRHAAGFSRVDAP